MLSKREKLILLDVREPEERALAKLRGSVFIPLMELQGRVDELREILVEKAGPLVIYCRSGKRSESAAAWLLSQGFQEVFNLRGGINAYAKEADTSLTPY